MSKVSILIVTGSFAFPYLYDNIVDALAAKGYEIRALQLRTASKKDGPAEIPPTMYDDAAFIAEETEKLADEGKDVLLLAHSYGGVPATQSTKGLGKAEREKQGKKGGLVRLAYMTCLVPAVGVPAAAVLAEVPEETRIELKIDEQGWMHNEPNARSAKISFSDLPEEEGLAWVAKLGRHSAVSFGNELTYAGYKDIPVSYLLCEDDLCIPAKVQKAGIEEIEKVSGKKVDVTSIKSGHSPSISKPQEVIDWILKIAGKV